MICFDLDDTLINTHKRHYQVVLDFLKEEHPALSGNFIGFTDYLHLRKSNSLSNYQVLTFLFGNLISKASFQHFFSFNIESPGYLQLDTRIVDITLLIKINIPLCICSLRTHEENAYRQLETLGLLSLFSEIHFLNHNKLENPKAIFFRNRENISHFIGDSQTDYEAVRDLDIKFIGVKTGLYHFSPETLFENTNQAIEALFL